MIIVLYSFLAVNNSFEFFSVILDFEKSHHEMELMKDSLFKEFTHSHEIVIINKVVEFNFIELFEKYLTFYPSLIVYNELVSVWHPPKFL